MLAVCGHDPSPWQDQTHWSDGRNAQDREQDIADEPHDEEPDREEEPSDEPLGWTEHINQDLALRPADMPYAFVGSEFESSLGSLTHVDQRHWSEGINDDRELALGSKLGEDA